MTEARDVRVPKLNANDTSYVLVEWLVRDGQHVSGGDPVAVVETSKATEELASDHPGYVQTLLPAGTECTAGQAVARLHPDPERSAAAGNGSTGTGPDPGGGSGTPGSGMVITGPAQSLMDEHGIDPARVRALGRRVVRREDIEALLDLARAGGLAPADPRGPDPAPSATVPAGAGEAQPLPRIQQAVAATVTESHRTVPAAFVAVKVPVDPALGLARQLSRQHRCLIGLPELVVKAVAAQHGEFPLCFAHPVDRTRVRHTDAAHVGVTVDVGGGLQVPVVHDAAALDWHTLAATMMDFRVTAMRGTFRPAQLAGGTVTVALHTDADVTVAVPLVFPGQVCAVSLPAAQPELVLDTSGEVTTRKVVQLGLAYDHRVINGSDAVAFLHAVKGLLGDPDRLRTLGTRPD